MTFNFGKIFATVVVVVTTTIALGQADAKQPLRLADVFTDNMVLQRGKPLKVWGWAKPGTKVEVLFTQNETEASTFARAALVREQPPADKKEPHALIGDVKISYVESNPTILKTVTKSATADEDGLWQVDLGVHKASFTPTYLAAKSGDETVAIMNALIGEVWIASGQSNMEWAGTRDKMWENRGLVFNGVRYAKVRGASTAPRDSFVPKDAVGRGVPFEPWLVCEDGKVNAVATVPYLFGVYLHRRLKVPVGVINIAQGGSFGHEWCSRELLEKMSSPTVDAKLAAYDAKKDGDGPVKWRGQPSELYNGRLCPIRRMTVAGVIYMQGENDSLGGTLPQYVKTFPGVIQSYRAALGEPDLPFGIITLQGYGGYAVAREIHLQTHKKTPNTGYVVAHDIGGNIHPSWKRPLCERAVYWALRDVYKVLDKVKQLRIKGASFDGNKALVTFEEAQLKDGKWSDPKATSPKTNDQQRPAGFEIAGDDHVWYRARIEIGSGNPAGLVLSHPFVKNPVAVRYAWCGFPCGNLGSWEDPSPPYRSDDWPIVAEDAVPDATAGKMSPSELNYLARHERRNRELENGLKLPIADSYEQMMKRYAHPKSMLIQSVENMRSMMQTFRLERCQSLAPQLAQLALYNIPCRYWRLDRYSPARRAKWGWLIERTIRLRTMPKEMEEALERPEIKTKVIELQKSLDLLQHELQQLPDPTPMTIDEMLTTVLKIMEKEKKRLTEEDGRDMSRFGGNLTKNPF